MNTSREHLEKILGGKIESLNEQPLPGLVPSPGEEVVFFSGDVTTDLGEQMKRLIGHIEPLYAKSGRVMATKHTLTLPEGQIFHAITCRGDIEGWRRQVVEGAKALGVLLGRIEGSSKFVLSDGRVLPLSQCKHGTL
jgi:hypothetical protein